MKENLKSAQHADVIFIICIKTEKLKFNSYKYIFCMNVNRQHRRPKRTCM